MCLCPWQAGAVCPLSIILSTTDVSTADGCENMSVNETLLTNQVEILRDFF